MRLRELVTTAGLIVLAAVDTIGARYGVAELRFSSVSRQQAETVRTSVPEAARPYQACAPLLPGPLPSNRVNNVPGPEGLMSTLSGLIQDSAVIVVGRLDSRVCRVHTPFASMGVDAPIVRSKFTVVVESAVRGAAPGARLSVIIEGLGRVVTTEGGFQSETENFESPKVGDRFLLFLKADAVDSDAFAVSAWRQGIFRVIDGETLRSPWRRTVSIATASALGQLDGKKTADVLAEVARIIGR